MTANVGNQRIKNRLFGAREGNTLAPRYAKDSLKHVTKEHT